jgi:Protein of unknown function (DUF3489)
MTIKLSDTQLILLSGAARRKDRCLAPPRGFKGAAALKAVERLLGAGYVTEVKGKGGVPVWRRDEIAVHDYCLKLTPSGLLAIGADSEGDAKPDAVARPEPNTTPNVAPAPMVAATAERAASTPLQLSAAPLAPRAPRPGTKISRVIALLSREGGTTLVEIVATTDWLPHTARAALTGLRKRGYAVERGSREEAGGSYFIAATTNSTCAAANRGAA